MVSLLLCTWRHWFRIHIHFSCNFYLGNVSPCGRHEVNTGNRGVKQWHCFSFIRILFWTDWDANFPRIESASMSGAGRKTIYKDMKTGAWPNGLTVDHFEKRIVWTDARLKTFFCAFIYFLQLFNCIVKYSNTWLSWIEIVILSFFCCCCLALENIRYNSIDLVILSFVWLA